MPAATPSPILNWKNLSKKVKPNPVGLGGWLAAVGLMLPSAIWIFWDKSVWAWDPSYYAELATNLWWDLSHHHVGGWLAHMETAFGSKAPGVAWLGQFFVPLGQGLGAVETGLLLSVWLFVVVAVRLMYDVGRAAGGGDARLGWLAAGLTGVAPLAVGMSQQFFVESLQLGAVVYVYWIAVALPGGSRVRLVAHSVLAVSLGMLAKASFPLYVITPCLVIVGRWWNEGRRTPKPPASRMPWALLVVAGVVAAMTADWYRVNFGTVRSFMQSAASGSGGMHYGHAGTFSSKMGYWLAATQQAFVAPLPGLILAGALAGSAWLAFRRRRREGWKWPRLVMILAVGSLAQVGFILVVFSQQINEETRYLLPMLPALVLPVVALLVAGRSRLLLATAALALAGQFIFDQQVSFGGSEPAPTVSVWLKPLQTDGGTRAEVTRLVAATSGDGHIVISGVELPWLNGFTLSFYAAKLRLDTNQLGFYSNLGYAETDPELGWKRLLDAKVNYFITLAPERQPAPPDFLNQITLAARNRVVQSGWFERQPFASARGIEIYRRRPDTPP